MTLPRLALAACLALASTAPALEPLAYHHKDLTVDLGVGLWAWPVPCDADGDGDFDLIVSCPDKPSNGVWFFENAGRPSGHPKLPTFKPARRLSSTVHYVTPSYPQGQLRVLTPGAEYPEFTTKGLATKTKVPANPGFYQSSGARSSIFRIRHHQWSYADFDGDQRPDLIAAVEDWSDYGWDNAYNADGQWTHGPLHGFLFVFRNTGSATAPAYADPFQIRIGDHPLETFGCPSPNFINCDDDDDLDLICGEFLDGFSYFENTGTSSEPRYAPATRLKDPDGREIRMDLQMIVPVAFDWDRDGDHDLITGDEDGRVAFIENLGRVTQGHAPVFLPPVYFQQEADTLKCGALATPACTDWDGDGDLDILSGNTAGYIEFFENLSGPRIAQPTWAAPRRLAADGNTFRIMAGPNGSIQGPAEAKWGYTTFSVADWNLDGLPDIVLNSILGDVVWLRNAGSRQSPALAAPQPIEVAWSSPQPQLAWGWRKPKGSALLTQWRTTPVVHDFNDDGLPDLAMLDHEGYLAFFERKRSPTGELSLAHPRRAFLNKDGSPLRLNPKSAGASGRRKLCVTDWDGDGQFDFLLNSANADFLRQTSSTESTWTFENAGSLAPRSIEGHDVSPATTDFDGNEIPDFLGGAEDGRFYFLPNPRKS